MTACKGVWSWTAQPGWAPFLFRWGAPEIVPETVTALTIGKNVCGPRYFRRQTAMPLAQVAQLFYSSISAQARCRKAANGDRDRQGQFKS
jgi:hypothetical protein